MGTMLYAASKKYQATKPELVETEATGLWSLISNKEATMLP